MHSASNVIVLYGSKHNCNNGPPMVIYLYPSNGYCREGNNIMDNNDLGRSCTERGSYEASPLTIWSVK
jgi:hypothetical protein